MKYSVFFHTMVPVTETIDGYQINTGQKRGIQLQLYNSTLPVPRLGELIQLPIRRTGSFEITAVVTRVPVYTHFEEDDPDDGWTGYVEIAVELMKNGEKQIPDLPEDLEKFLDDPEVYWSSV